jgi:hypothetical protein
MVKEIGRVSNKSNELDEWQVKKDMIVKYKLKTIDDIIYEGDLHNISSCHEILQRIGLRTPYKKFDAVIFEEYLSCLGVDDILVCRRVYGALESWRDQLYDSTMTITSNDEYHENNVVDRSSSVSSSLSPNSTEFIS